MPVQARCERGTRKNNACALPQRNAVAREPVPNNSMQPEQSSSGQREEGGGWARGLPVGAAHLQRGRAGGARSEGKHERRPHGKRGRGESLVASGERKSCSNVHSCEMSSISSTSGTVTSLFLRRRVPHMCEMNTSSSRPGTETAGRGLAPDKIHVGKPSVTRKKSRNGRASRSLNEMRHFLRKRR